MNQARILDTSWWWGQRNVDPDKIRANFDAVGISAGVGNKPSDCLQDQIDTCETAGLLWFTFHIPHPGLSMAENARTYASYPRVRDGVMCADYEPPQTGVRCVNPAEGRQYRDLLQNITGRLSWSYINIDRLNTWSWPRWLMESPMWIAVYPYQVWPPFTLYKYFEPFLKKFAGKMPSKIANSIYRNNCAAWQFTKKGDAQKYAARPGSVKECDLSVSTIEKVQFLEMLIP